MATKPRAHGAQWLIFWAIPGIGQFKGRVDMKKTYIVTTLTYNSFDTAEKPCMIRREYVTGYAAARAIVGHTLTHTTARRHYAACADCRRKWSVDEG